MKTAKFLLCHDILADENQTDEFVLHMHHPRFLAKIEELEFIELDHIPEKPFADVLYINPQGSLEIYRIEVVELLERASDEDIRDELFNSREFYAAFLQQSDLASENKAGYPVKDFSPELPGLKILQGQGTWTVVYNGIISEFDNEDNMDEFLEHDLSIDANLLDKGIINQF